jgi:hypothetical protein
MIESEGAEVPYLNDPGPETGLPNSLKSLTMLCTRKKTVGWSQLRRDLLSWVNNLLGRSSPGHVSCSIC